MRDPGLDELQLDRSDAAVVHVRGGNTVRAGLRIRKRHIADSFYGKRVVQPAVLAQHAAVAVRRVLAQTDVGDDVQLREARAEELDRLDDGALRVVGRGAEGVFRPGFQRHAEEDHAA